MQMGKDVNYTFGGCLLIPMVCQLNLFFSLLSTQVACLLFFLLSFFLCCNFMFNYHLKVLLYVSAVLQLILYLTTSVVTVEFM